MLKQRIARSLRRPIAHWPKKSKTLRTQARRRPAWLLHFAWSCQAKSSRTQRLGEGVHGRRHHHRMLRQHLEGPHSTRYGADQRKVRGAGVGIADVTVSHLTRLPPRRLQLPRVYVRPSWLPPQAPVAVSRCLSTGRGRPGPGHWHRPHSSYDLGGRLFKISISFMPQTVYTAVEIYVQ